MSNLKKKIIIDNDSLIHFFNYYFFDRDSKRKIYKDIVSFFKDKVEDGEIIIIDKVIKEFLYIENNNDFSDIKKDFKSRMVNTEHLFNEVEKLLDKHKNQNRNLKLSTSEEETEAQDMLDKHADLYLVALANQYIKEDKNTKVFVISNESLNQRGYRKLTNKIPVICRVEGILCYKVTHMLFNIYKEELLFDLNVKCF